MLDFCFNFIFFVSDQARQWRARSVLSKTSSCPRSLKRCSFVAMLLKSLARWPLVRDLRCKKNFVPIYLNMRPALRFTLHHVDEVRRPCASCKPTFVLCAAASLSLFFGFAFALSSLGFALLYGLPSPSAVRVPKYI